MNTAHLKAWAQEHGSSPVEDHPDRKLSISSKLLRFRWNGAPAVGVGADASGGVRINAVIDGLAWFLDRTDGNDDTLHVVLGSPGTHQAVQEHVGAIATLAFELRRGPTVRVWFVSAKGEPTEVEPVVPRFTTDTPSRWNKLLMAAAVAPIEGVAADLVAAVHHPAFALYPKLSSLKAAQPWQIRLDGLEIGRVGKHAVTLALATTNLAAPGKPRDTWRQVIGLLPRSVPVDEAAQLIDGLVAEWSTPGQPTAVLDHGHPEHALEAHVLSGRLPLSSANGPLRLAVPFRQGMLGAAQFPTLWGDVTRPARYLDALLRDADDRPWAIELKDQDAGGGHGAYLRHGVAQAVLYRHFIRSADALEPWFAHHHLDRRNCRAALAFPLGKTGAAKTIERLQDLAAGFDVEVITFIRP